MRTDPIINTRIQWAISRVREIMGNPDLVYLPSIRTLAKSCRTGIHIISAAVRLLRDAGELDFRRGQKMRVASRWPRMSAPAASKGSSLLTAYQELRRRMETAELRVGNSLPKRLNLARDLDIGDRTLTMVLDRLSSERFLHRRRRCWIVGQRLDAARRFAGDPPTILIVLLEADAWSTIEKATGSALTNAFVNECSAQGVRILFCHLKDSYGSNAYAAVGIDAILAKAAKLQANYRGALVAGCSPRGAGAFHRVAGGLARFQRPVLWLDILGERVSVPEAVGRRLCRCGFDEREMAAVAASFLRSMGHSQIGFAGYFHGWLGLGKTAWENERKMSLAREISRTIPDGRLVAYDDACNEVCRLDADAFSALLQSSRIQKSPALRKLVDYLYVKLTAANPLGQRKGPRNPAELVRQGYANFRLRKSFEQPFWALLEPLSVLLLHPEITAIVVRDLASAEIMVERFVRADIRIPADLSILSYDSLLSAKLPVRRFDSKASLLSLLSHRITTIECGAERLGYLAFHRICGDLPVFGKPKDSIIAMPRIADRWSIAPLSQRAGREE